MRAYFLSLRLQGHSYVLQHLSPIHQHLYLTTFASEKSQTPMTEKVHKSCVTRVVLLQVPRSRCWTPERLIAMQPPTALCCACTPSLTLSCCLLRATDTTSRSSIKHCVPDESFQRVQFLFDFLFIYYKYTLRPCVILYLDMRQ